MKSDFINFVHNNNTPTVPHIASKKSSTPPKHPPTQLFPGGMGVNFIGPDGLEPPLIIISWAQRCFGPTLII
jgi:hypothetical protein